MAGNGYIQVELGGVLRGLKFDQGALHEMHAKLGDSNNDSFRAYCLIWGALVSNCFRKQTDIDFTFEQICDWADELKDEQLNEILSVYIERFDFAKDLPTDEPAGDKKKIIKKNSPHKNTKRSALK